MHLNFKILDHPKLCSSGIPIVASCSIFQLLSVPQLPELHLLSHNVRYVVLSL